MYPGCMSDKPVTSRRDEYADATRSALLDAAREAFVAEGFQQAAVEAISRRARVTRGAFYHHFADKKALFEALVVALQADATTRLAQRARLAGQPLDRLRQGIRGFLEVCAEPAYRRLVIQDAPAVLGPRRCREIEDEHVQGLLVRALKELKAAGVIDVADATLAARMIGAMVCEAALMQQDARQPRALERHALALVDRFLAALATG
jgi:AcrR family transcriptional regulator